MNEMKVLAYYETLKYDIHLRQCGDNFVLFIPELSIIEEDENLEKAYEKIEKAKIIYFKKMIEMDSQDLIKEPGTSHVKQQKSFSIPNFNLLLIPVILLIVIMIAALAGGFIMINSSKFAIAANNIAQGAVYGAMYAAELSIRQKFVDSNAMSDEDKENLRMKVRKTAKNLKPYFDELRILYDDTFQIDEETSSRDEPS
ncbi:hypothetical protein ACFL1R_12540 [Candidatus Latescibacterota bacterium]